jgi:hypothetical protein
MNKWIKSCSIALLAITCVVNACSEAAHAETASPMLWKVTSDNNTSYLFGTMHVSHPSVTTLKPAVEDAFSKSDAIFTELKESQVDLTAKVVGLGMLPSGTKLDHVIPSDMYSKLKGIVESNNMSMMQFDIFHPWMAGMQLQLIDAMPYMKGIALDMQLTNRAREEKKEVGGIETIEEQMAALAYGTDEEQIHLLGIAIDKMIEDVDNKTSDIAIMLGDYILGDIEAMWDTVASELVGADEIQLAYIDALLIKRNVNMAARIDKRIKSHPESTTFYAFGALHFAGPDSVNQLLKNMGYKVERVTR